MGGWEEEEEEEERTEEGEVVRHPDHGHGAALVGKGAEGDVHAAEAL